MNTLRYSYKNLVIKISPVYSRLFHEAYFLSHKARLRIIFLSIIMIFMSFMATATAASPASSQYIKPSMSIATSYYLGSINELRLQKGLKPLDNDYRLDKSALNKVDNMISTGYWGHNSPSDIKFSDFIWQVKPSAKLVGENMARCYETRQAAFDSLAASPTHLSVMTDKRFKYFGVAEEININEHCIYTVMHFSN